jgi:AcrR family transcriptional regulator
VGSLLWRSLIGHRGLHTYHTNGLYNPGVDSTAPTLKRRTQVERRQATRTALLDATVSCLIEDGYANTTTRGIAERAKVSPGALQHHFASKQELVSEAIAYLTQRVARDLIERGLPSADSQRQLAEKSIDLLWELQKGPLIEAATELWVAARTDPSLRQRLAEAQREAVEMVAVTARQLFPRQAAQPGFVELISTVLAALRGMVLLGFVSPTDRETAWAAGRTHLLSLLADWEPRP